MSEPKKGLSPLAWIGIGCGGIMLIGIIVLGIGGYFAAKTVAEYADDPAALAEAIIDLNPELEVVESDREAGTITIENAEGNRITVDYAAIQRGELNFTDDNGEQISMSASGAAAAAGEGGPLTITSSDGSSMAIGGSGDAIAVPGWLGKFPGNKTNEGGYATTSNGKRTGVHSFATDDAEGALGYYAERIEELGMEVDRSSFSGGGNTMQSVTGRNSDYQITAAATTNGSETRMTVTYSGPAE